MELTKEELEQKSRDVLNTIRAKHFDDELLNILQDIALSLAEDSRKSGHYDGIVIGFKTNGSRLFDIDFVYENDASWCRSCGQYSFNYKITLTRGGVYKSGKNITDRNIKCHAFFDISCNNDNCDWYGKYGYQGHYIEYYENAKCKLSRRFYEIPITIVDFIEFLKKDGIP